tara:strand:- start:544 stop:705 length:162 start_codon:yes stop_codon:yes gene_type:complete
MGKLKDVKFGNKSFKDYEDDFLDDEYHYDKWRRESKKKKTVRPDRGDEDEGEY